MKIPSAIKRTLAAVLSAAMVVAFAPPTAALAYIAPGETVTVHYDANGGTVNGTLADETATVAGAGFNKGSLTLSNAVDNGKKCTKGNAAVDFWFFDAGGAVGVYDDDIDVAAGNNSLNVTGNVVGVGEDGNEITLKASYKDVLVDIYLSFNTAVSDYDPNGTTTITVKTYSLDNGTYKAVVVNNNKEFPSDELTVSDETSKDFAVKVKNSELTAGDVTAYIVDSAGKKVAVKGGASTHIYTLTYNAGEYGKFSDDDKEKTFLAVKWTKLSNINLGTLEGSTYTFNKWALEDGSEPENLVHRDLTLVAQYNNPKVSKLTFEHDPWDPELYKLSYEAENLPKQGDEGYTDLESYKVTVLHNGTVIYGHVNTDAASSGSIDSTDFAFKQTENTNEGTTAEATTGTYTVKVEAQYATDTMYIEDFSVEKSVTVCPIVLDANGGKAPDSATYLGTKALTLIQAGKNLKDISFYTSSGNDYGYTNDDSTLAFDGWSVDGFTVADADEVIAQKDGSAITLKALWKVCTGKPTLVSATKDGSDTHTLVFASVTSGAKLTYKLIDSSDNIVNVGDVPAAGLTGVSDTYWVQVTAFADNLESQLEDFYGRGYKSSDYNNKSVSENFEDFTDKILKSTTADEQTPTAVTYNSVDAVKNAVTAGKTAIETQAFATRTQWEKLYNQQKKAVVGAVTSYATSQIEPLRELTSADGKTYSKLSDADYAKAAKWLNAIANLRVDELPAAIKTIEDGDSNNSEYAVYANNVVKWARSAAAANTYDAADAEPAQDVIDALKAAKSASAAKAAIEAYNKLTDTQKTLVSIDDVTAAYDVIIAAESAAASQAASEAAAAKKEAEQARKDAEQAKQDAEQYKKDAEQYSKEAEQYSKEAAAYEQARDEAIANRADLKAAGKLTNKRVVAKAKTGKKVRGKAFSYKLAASTSGATATYAKASGSKYIKVSANGKVTFAKVKAAKKAKTFTAKVSVTFGTQTITRTVTYVVKALRA